MTRAARLAVDPIACDDWGFPVIEGDIPASLQKEAAAVVRLCPRLALRLEQAPAQ
jgi:ferredoxin